MIAGEPEPVAANVTDETESGASLEVKFGKVWLVRIGVVLVLTGLVVLANLGYQGLNPEIRPYINATLLYLVSFGMMAAGLFLHQRFEFLKNFSEVLTGGGMAAVYFSTYALYFIKDPKILGLIKEPIVASVLLGAWAIFIIVFATRKRSETMAMFAVAGAYYASYVPLINDPNSASIWFTFASNIALALAATFFVIKNRWANLSFLALLTTYAGFAYWRFQHAVDGSSDFWQDALFLGVYWVIFTAAGFLSRHEQMTPAKRATFINLNNGAFFALMTITLLQVPTLREHYWVLPMAFGPVLLGLFVLAKKWLPEEKLFAEVLLAKAATLVTLALMTLQPAEQYRALLLGAECITLLFFGLRTGNRLLQYAAAIIALVGAAFVGIEVGQTAWNERGGFDSPTLVLGLAFGLLLLIAGWVAKFGEGDREPSDPLRTLPDYLATIGLGCGLATCLAVTAQDFQAATALALAAFGLVALGSRSLFRIGAVAVFAEIFLLVGLLLWLPLGFAEKSGLPAWSPLVMLGIFALAQQWHQRLAVKEEDSASSRFFLSTICQAACVIGMGLIVVAWSLRLLHFDLEYMAIAAVIIGLIFSTFGYGLCSGQLSTFGQISLIGAPGLCALQIILPGPSLTWQWAMIPLFTALGNGLALNRAKEHLAGRLETPPLSLEIHSNAAQVVSLLSGLVIALKFVDDAHLLWALPLVGIALSTFCLGLRLTPSLIASQSFILIAALLAPFKMFVPEAEIYLTLIPVLAMLGMSHFLLHWREMIEENARALRTFAIAGTGLYFYYGWALALVWAFKFVDDKFIFLLFTVVAITHTVLHGRRERLDRAIVAGGFLLAGFMSFWVHAIKHWGETAWADKRPLDIAPLLLLLGAQWLSRQRDPEKKIPNGVHVAAILLINLSLWQWVIRMFPGDAGVISWGVLAFVLIGLGLLTMERTHRLFGLMVLLVSIANLTLLAWQTLHGGARILTFIGMGVILIVLGALYAKYQDKLKEYL
jgi:hypothetical protein